MSDRDYPRLARSYRTSYRTELRSESSGGEIPRFRRRTLADMGHEVLRPLQPANAWVLGSSYCPLTVGRGVMIVALSLTYTPVGYLHPVSAKTDFRCRTCRLWSSSVLSGLNGRCSEPRKGMCCTWPNNGQEGVGKPHYAHSTTPISVPSPQRLEWRTVHSFTHPRPRNSDRDSAMARTCILRVTREHDDCR